MQGAGHPYTPLHDRQSTEALRARISERQRFGTYVSMVITSATDRVAFRITFVSRESEGLGLAEPGRGRGNH